MAPIDSSPATTMGGFELICSLKSNDTIPVHKYKSIKTGITVFIAEVDGPVVSGNFCLATEAYDDDGLPHTLEHLIFLGSEDYPYKGVLDLLGNRCLASGTNAWTDRDHTNYTMTTVGSEGFLSLMPIYLDHILFPNLTDSAFLTEVHHITGTGEDHGVVYCEMQSRENTAETLCWTELGRAIYPGKCGYKSITGGILQNLRESTTNEKVREYHKQYYRSENLTIIITGQVQHADVFKALHRLEEKILSKGNRGVFERPWQSPVPPFSETVIRNVSYPCDDEDNGLVTIGWRGPSAVNELYEFTACSLLLKYLTETSVSPLKKEFVEIDDPYACDVEFSLLENSISVLYLMFSGVPISKVPLVKHRLEIVLADVLKTGIDMRRITTVIHRHKLETLSHLENKPHHAIAFMLIGDALYGQGNKDLEQRLNTIDDLNKLAQESTEYWLGLLKKYFINTPMAVINATPSVAKQKELEAAEKARIAERRNQLGNDGLKAKEQEYLDAVAKNDQPIPDEVITSVPIPGTDSINFHNVKRYLTGADQHPNFNVNDLSLFTHLDHVNTNFVHMFLIMGTAQLSQAERRYLPLIMECLGKCPIRRFHGVAPELAEKGDYLSYEDVVAELENDTINIDAQLGLRDGSRFSCGVYGHYVSLMLQLEMGKYAKGVQWLHELMFNTIFEPDRLKILASKMINEISQLKKDGYRITGDLMDGIVYKEDSNIYSVSLLRQQKFLAELGARLADEKDAKLVVEEMNEVLRLLVKPENMMLHMATNVDKLCAHVDDLVAAWKLFDRQLAAKTAKKQIDIVKDWQLVKSRVDILTAGCVLGLGCVESSFMAQTGPCVNDYESPDVAPLMVCLQYLTQIEGPMWRQVRGQGLAYGVNISANPNSGHMYLSFYGSTNIVSAYKEAKNIVCSLIENNSWERLLYDSAKSSLIFEIVNREKSVADAVSQSLLSYFKNVSHDHNRTMVQKIYTVSIKDLTRVANKYIKPLFDPEVCNTAIVCHPSKVLEVTEAFKTFGHKLEMFTSLEKSYLCSQ